MTKGILLKAGILATGNVTSDKCDRNSVGTILRDVFFGHCVQNHSYKITRRMKMIANIIASSPLGDTASDVQQKKMCKGNKQKEFKK